jgi:DNA polymerase-3 subunit alpha
MAFVKIEDDTGSIEVVIFPRLYSNTKDLLIADKPIIIEGETDWKDENVVIIAHVARSIDSTKEQIDNQTLEVVLPIDTDRYTLKKVYDTLKSFPGSVKTLLIIPGKNGDIRKIPIPITLSIDDDLVRILQDLGCSIQS